MKLSDKKRQQIILAAVEEFRKSGFSNTSMDTIAKAAQVSKRTIYNHFKCKEDLFTGIVSYMFTLMKSTELSDFNPDSCIEKQLLEIAYQKIKLFSSDTFINFSKVVIPEGIHNPERIYQAQDQVAEIEQGLDNWFNQAISAGQLNNESGHEAGNKFIGLIKMEAFWPRLFKGTPAPNNNEIQKMAEQTVGMFLSYHQTKSSKL